MFPGYLFLHHAMDHKSYITILETRGVVGVLGERWDRLAVVPDEEVEAIQAVVHTRAPVLPYPYSHAREGLRVRIIGGPLANVEGILVKSKPDRGLLVLSIRLLQRSVAVEIDYSLVAAA
jgi:transcription antitermination factor NusG